MYFSKCMFLWWQKNSMVWCKKSCDISKGVISPQIMKYLTGWSFIRKPWKVAVFIYFSWKPAKLGWLASSPRKSLHISVLNNLASPFVHKHNSTLLPPHLTRPGIVPASTGLQPGPYREATFADNVHWKNYPRAVHVEREGDIEGHQTHIWEGFQYSLL